MKRAILITGGSGYIGSHPAVELMAAGRDVFIIDNFCNSKSSVLDRIERIAGRRPEFAHVDIQDRTALRPLFSAHRFDAVIHFAGLKAAKGTISSVSAHGRLRTMGTRNSNEPSTPSSRTNVVSNTGIREKGIPSKEVCCGSRSAASPAMATRA